VAFTLVELLAVIAIIGLLLAVLVPAVQTAREAARRATCSNNLAQLGKATAAYEAANGHFPPGSIGNAAYSWVVAMLPQLEQQPTYDKLRGIQDPNLLWAGGLQDGGGYQVDVHPVLDVATLICPTSPLPRRLPRMFPGAGNVLVPSYVAVTGASDSAFRTVTPANTDRCVPGPGIQECRNGIMAADWDAGRGLSNAVKNKYSESQLGQRPLSPEIAADIRTNGGLTPGTRTYFFFFPEEGRLNGCRSDQVLDGLSNCLLLGEQSDWGWLTPAVPGNPPERGYCRSAAKGWPVGQFTPWDSVKRGFSTAKVNRSLGSKLCERYATHPSLDLPYSSHDNEIAFFSAHGPGAMFVFGDASVRWLDESIDFNLYQRLAIRDTVRGNATLPNGSANIKMLP
jgi:type II secretory pathway pseudopilin PulG